MNQTHQFARRYDKSWAIIVGINDYETSKPLQCAVNDAQSVASILKERFDFQEERIALLLNEEATRENILDQLHGLSDKVGSDDRVLFFFAGHGLTRRGNRGDVGFLIPVNGEAGKPRTLIEWRELTKSAEFLSAKHALFIMDACYGGLAVSRTIGGAKKVFGRLAWAILEAGSCSWEGESGGL